jgi:hypothetical protein
MSKDWLRGEEGGLTKIGNSRRKYDFSTISRFEGYCKQNQMKSTNSNVSHLEQVASSTYKRQHEILHLQTPQRAPYV